MNTAYKHLDSKLRVAELSIGQWICVLAGLAAAIAWGVYLSPLSTSFTLVTSVYLVALPVAAALFSSLTDFDPWLVIRSAVHWHRQEGSYLPGPGVDGEGYTVTASDEESGSRTRRRNDAVPDLAGLWGES